MHWLIQDSIPVIAVSNEVTRTVTNEKSTVGVDAAAAQVLKALANSRSVQSTSHNQGLEPTCAAIQMYTGLRSYTSPASVPDNVLLCNEIQVECLTRPLISLSIRTML